MKKLLTVLLVVAGVASAAGINGSASIGAFGATENGTNLSNSTLLTPVGEFWGLGSGDFSTVVPGTPITDPGIDTTNLAGFSWTSIDGTFSGVTFSDILTQTASNLDIFLIGTFTPAGVLSTFSAGAASYHLSLTQTGNSVSWSATLASPPESLVPEPASMMLLGSALLGLGAFRRFRKA